MILNELLTNMAKDDGIQESIKLWNDGYLEEKMACSCSCHEDDEIMCSSCLLEHISKQAD